MSQNKSHIFSSIHDTYRRHRFRLTSPPTGVQQNKSPNKSAALEIRTEMMTRLMLAGTAFLALVASGAARAVPIDFTYTGSVADFTIPTTDTYQILAFGAQGGSGQIHFPPPETIGPGGLGAEIGGDFLLTAGEVLQIAVGGAGSDLVGGGGGGSFVVGPGNSPLVIAGGGGGGANPGGPLPGQGGLTSPDGGNAGGSGGTNGNGGGGGGSFGGGGGGGLLGAGGAGVGPEGPGGTGGAAFPDLTGGFDGGGFGGGGGGGPLTLGGSGGGGGYSGGGGGGRELDTTGPGGGGGSFDAGIDQILVANFQAGNGEVVINELISEPASIALLGAGLVGFMVVWGRRPER
jgi:hypothetical protein